MFGRGAYLCEAAHRVGDGATQGLSIGVQLEREVQKWIDCVGLVAAAAAADLTLELTCGAHGWWVVSVDAYGRAEQRERSSRCRR